jgi:Restriction endonuclease fold toxin 7
MPTDPPFDASNPWWPSPGWPRSGPLGGPPYPDYWTDPFINSRAIAPAAPAPFSAAQLGAMAWHPPIFPGDASTFAPGNFPTTAGSQQRASPATATSSADLIPALSWPYAGLFSLNPSLPVGGGLFPYPLASDPEPTSPFGDGLFSGNPAASAALPGRPGASPAPGWPVTQSFLPPLPSLQSPFAVGGPTFDGSSSLRPSPTDSPAAPMAPQRSVLFNRPPPDWDLGSASMARDRDAAALDSTAQGLGANGLPRSKSGAPYVSPAPQLSFEPPQWHDVARLLAPNIVDYLTKPLPPTPPFPPTPGKIPSSDNPHAPGAAFEAATWLPFGLERGIVGPLVGAVKFADKSATGTLAKIIGEAASGPLAAPILDRVTLMRLNVELGRLGEEAVGIPANAPKPSIQIPESGVIRYPDRLTEKTIEEVKNVKYLAFTQQLRDYLAHAIDNDLTFILHARPETTYSGPLRQLIDADQIKLKLIPRPSK